MSEDDGCGIDPVRLRRDFGHRDVASMMREGQRRENEEAASAAKNDREPVEVSGIFRVGGKAVGPYVEQGGQPCLLGDIRAYDGWHVRITFTPPGSFSGR